MKKLFLVILITLSGFCLKAQTNLDSLLGIWNDESQTDTSRLNAIVVICSNIARNQPDSTFVLVDLVLEFKGIDDYKKYLADAYLQQGRAHHYRGDLAQSEESWEKSLAISEDIEDQYRIAHVLAYFTGHHVMHGDYDLAIKSAERTLEISKKIESKYLSSFVSKPLGYTYIRLGNNVKALKVFETGLRDAEQIGEKLTVAYCLHAIADIYLEQGEQAKDKEYHNRSLAIYEEIGDMIGIADVLGHMASINLANGEYALALDTYNRVIGLLEILENRVSLAEKLIGLAQVYSATGQYTEGLRQLDRVIKIIDETGSEVLTPQVYREKGRIDQLQGNYAQAIGWCTQSLQIAEKNGLLQLQRDACECLYESNKALKRGNAALAYHEQLLQLSYRLNSEETAKKLQQMEFAKEMLADSLLQEEQKLKVEMVHQEEMRKEEKTRNIVLSGGFILLILSGGIYSRLRYIRKSKTALQIEKDRSENLLLNILPADIAEELKMKGKADARDFEMVSILFTDFKGFTQASAKLKAQDLVSEINACFEAFDGIVSKYGIEKIKTIGDAYMAAGGLPVPTDDSVRNTVLSALEMQAFIENRKSERDAIGKPAFEMRVGIHTGPVVAGIVGVKKFQYDIWGDTVNTASRMESNGVVGEVNISQSTYELLKTDPEFAFETRGKIEAKGKGEIEMYFVSKA